MATREDQMDSAPGMQHSTSSAVTRTSAILALLASRPEQPIGPSEVARRVGVPKSTVLNLCAAMVQEGLLRRGNSGYQLGSRLASLGNAYLQSVTEVEEFYELCRAKGSLTGLNTVQLGVLGDGLSVIYLARHDGKNPLNLGLASEIGRSVPAYCTANGKALLAATTGVDLDARLPTDGRLIPLTANSLDSVGRLLDELQVTRERGYAVERGEIVEGLHCLGIAVRTPHRSDSLLGLSFTFARPPKATDFARAGVELREFAAAFAERIGGALAS